MRGLLSKAARPAASRRAASGPRIADGSKSALLERGYRYADAALCSGDLAGKIGGLSGLPPMFNDIAAAGRSPSLASPHGLTFADLYTVEGAARVDALFLADLEAADAALAQRLAAARAAPDGLAAK